jgi:hypothetical protein
VRWIEAQAQTQARASPASPFATSVVDEGATLDGGAPRVYETARGGVGCLARRNNARRAEHKGEMSEQAFHAGRERGRESALLLDLVVTGSARGAVRRGAWNR